MPDHEALSREPNACATGIKRRDWLKLGGLSAAGLALAGCNRRPPHPSTAHAAAGAAASAGAAVKARKPRNVILMISDGMSAGVPTLAELMSPGLRDRGTVMARMLADHAVERTLIATESANSWVTDSAAAATAIGSGRVTNNGSINVTPDSGEPMATMAQHAHQTGRHIGLVTTDRVSGATPAGFAAVHAERNEQEDIAAQMVGEVDVLLGGGQEKFDPLARADAQDLFATARVNGRKLIMDRDRLLAAAPSDRCLGLFGEGKLPYTIDHRQSRALREQVPTLSEMTAYALACLRDRGEGFFLMVEAARVDHAAHVNDAAAMLWDQLAFDDAVDVAHQFAGGRDDTLLIVTTDHGNANPGLNGMGERYAGSTEAGRRLALAKSSFAALAEPLMLAAAQSSADAQVRRLVREALGLELNGVETQHLLRAIDKDGTARDHLDADRFDRQWFSMLAQVAGNHHGIGWTSTAHTHDAVQFMAQGPAAATFRTARHHVDVSETLREAMVG